MPAPDERERALRLRLAQPRPEAGAARGTVVQVPILQGGQGLVDRRDQPADIEVEA